MTNNRNSNTLRPSKRRQKLLQDDKNDSENENNDIQNSRLEQVSSFKNIYDINKFDHVFIGVVG